jgi:ABC-2 type transport system permease protein
MSSAPRSLTRSAGRVHLRSLAAMYWVWRRELQVTLRAPILYVIGGLFLVVQGIAFAGLVNALSDTRRPAPLGALLEGQLSGTLLTWVLQLVVLTLLGMRTIADDRRNGGWELLLTAQVGEGAAVIGKWLAAVTIYALLWVPTLAYLAVVAMFRTDSGGWDVPTIITGYLGAFALGAALLTLVVAASAAMSTTLAAGALGFAALIGLFLVGELPAVWPDLATDHPSLASALASVSLRDQLSSFARGELGLGPILFVIALAVFGLSLAITLACAGRRRAREVRSRAFASVLVVVIAACAGVLAHRHPKRWDVSAAHRNSLDPQTRAVLAEMPSRATLTIIEPTLGALAPLYDEVARVADRMAEAGPLTVHRVDPAALPGGLTAAARIAGLAPGDLASNGGVVVELGGRRRVVDRLQIATIDLDASGGHEIQRLAIEQAIAGVLAELSSSTPITVCATLGHGELPLLAKADKDADWTAVADRLRADGIAVEEVPLNRGVPARCNVLLVIGPASALAQEEAFAVQTFVQHGGGLLVAAASRPVTAVQGTALASTGLEAVLAAEGLGIPALIAVDPAEAIRELPGALLVVDGYAPHAINDGFAQARATLWFQPRPVVASGKAQPLVRASAASWGESDFVHAPSKDGGDLAGPVTLAAIGTHRVIAVGSAESFMTSILSGGASAGDLWLARAIRYLAGKPAPHVSIAARAPDQVRLVMTASERRMVIALSTVGIPVVWIVIGAAIVVWRRRRVL